MLKTIDRRKFFTDSALSAAGIMLGGKVTGAVLKEEEKNSSYNIMKELMKYRKIDSHCHVSDDKSTDFQIDIADRLGIEFLSISRPLSWRFSPISEGTPEEFIRCNDIIYRAMKRYPDRFIGMFTLNPYYKKESLEEISRRADQGFVGFKGHALVKINDPLFYPIIEKLIDLKMICMMHAECELGVGGYRMKYTNEQKKVKAATIPEDMMEAATRYPEAIFQYAHISIGDFEYVCKAFKDYPNIYVDLSGSNNDERKVDFCLKYLGEDRLFFGYDASNYYQCVGSVLASEATETQKRKIFFDNYNNVLKKGGYNVA